MEADYLGFLEWLYGVKLNAKERKHLLGSLRSEWESPDEETYQGAASTLESARQVKQQPKEMLPIIRASNLVQMLPGLYRDADGDPDVAVILGAYERAHPTLAQGSPPLSSEVANAKANYLQFVVREGSNGGIVLDTGALREQLAATYSQLSADEQAETLEALMMWEQLKVKWKQISSAEREQVRDRWRAQVAALHLTRVVDDEEDSSGSAPQEAPAAAPASEESPSQESASSGRSMAGIFNGYVDAQRKMQTETPPPPADTGSGGSRKPMTAAEAQRQLYMDQMKSQMISNMMQMQHQSAMNILANSPGAPSYKWVWTYK
jgi:hypothetical protein